jgi:hypothetical protein
MDYLTKTDAKKDYFLTDSELLTIESIQKPNPYRKRTMMTLYKKNDIIEYLKYKYDTSSFTTVEEKISELKSRKESRTKARMLTLQNKRNNRKYELCNELAKYGLRFRTDSKLCQGYIDGTIKDKSLEWICQRMCQMKYLFEYCHIDQEIQKVKQEKYFDDEYMYESPFDIAEERILNRIQKYPDVYPWIRHT